MNKEFITYEQALALKELGFKEKCLASFYTYDIENFKEDKFDYRGKFNVDYYSEDDYIINTDKSYYIATPLYQQAFRWFREKYRLYPIIDSFVGVKGVVKFFYKLPMYDETFDTYEEAESACLDKLIEIVKSKVD